MQGQTALPALVFLTTSPILKVQGLQPPVLPLAHRRRSYRPRDAKGFSCSVPGTRDEDQVETSYDATVHDALAQGPALATCSVPICCHDSATSCLSVVLHVGGGVLFILVFVHLCVFIEHLLGAGTVPYLADARWSNQPISAPGGVPAWRLRSPSGPWGDLETPCSCPLPTMWWAAENGRHSLGPHSCR